MCSNKGNPLHLSPGNKTHTRTHTFRRGSGGEGEGEGGAGGCTEAGIQYKSPTPLGQVVWGSEGAAHDPPCRPTPGRTPRGACQ